MPEPAIETIGLTKRYGTLTALDELTLMLEKGDVFGFIGPNGAGKSTTMKFLAGLLEQTQGTAKVLGKDVREHGRAVRKLIGYMPDFIGVYDDLTVAEYLEFFAGIYEIHGTARRKVVNDVLELTDLTYKRDAMVNSLSRGMTQRLSLARVLVHDPPVLLLDEPASGLDPRARIEIRELLRELQRLGKTIMISSHILSELGEFCTKLGIIETGRLLAFGTQEQLIEQSGVHGGVGLRVQGPPESAIATLRADDRVESVEQRNGELLVTLRQAGTHHGFVAASLVQAGVTIESLTPHRPKLEDVFLRLTTGAVQ